MITHSQKSSLHVHCNNQLSRMHRYNSLAGLGSLGLELRYLSKETGNRKYAQHADRIMQLVLREVHWDKTSQVAKLFSKWWDPATGKRPPHLEGILAGLGVGGDSFYEYSLKELLLDPSLEHHRKLYEQLAESLRQEPGVPRQGGQPTVTRQGDYAFVVEETSWEHLSCFVAGMLALGSQALNRPQDLPISERIAAGCLHMYDRTPTGLADDQAFVRGAGQFQSIDPSFKLRPELVESLFVLWRVTKKQEYREAGWRIFLQIEKHCKLEDGSYISLKDVHSSGLNAAQHVEHGNVHPEMPSYFMAETMKYLLLLFSDEDEVPISKFVFNTEGHPLTISSRCSTQNYTFLPPCSDNPWGALDLLQWPVDELFILFVLTILVWCCVRHRCCQKICSWCVCCTSRKASRWEN